MLLSLSLPNSTSISGSANLLSRQTAHDHPGAQGLLLGGIPRKVLGRPGGRELSEYLGLRISLSLLQRRGHNYIAMYSGLKDMRVVLAMHLG